jgi:hypothetical protein
MSPVACGGTYGTRHPSPLGGAKGQIAFAISSVNPPTHTRFWSAHSALSHLQRINCQQLHCYTTMCTERTPAPGPWVGRRANALNI